MFAAPEDKNAIELQLIGAETTDFENQTRIQRKSKISEPEITVSKPKYNKTGIYYTFLAVISTVALAVVWKWNPNLPKAEVLTFRSFVACIISYFLLKKSGGNQSLKELFSKENVVVGFCGAGSIAAYAVGLLGLPVSEAITIYATLGIFNGIFGLLLLKEAYPMVERLLGCVCFVGVVLIVKPPFIFGEEAKPENAQPPLIPRFLGAFLVLASAALWSLMQIILRGVGNNKSSGVAAVFQNNFSGLILCLLYVLVTGEFQALNFEGYVTATLLALCNLGCTWAIIKALEYEKPSVVGVVGYSEIIFAVLADLLIFHNLPSLLTIFGMSIIIGSCLFIMKSAH